MKALVAGHQYELDNFENPSEKQILQFIHKDADPVQSSPGKLMLIQDGTTNEEVLECLIDRMNYLNKKFPCRENSIVITNLEQALMWLEKRTRDMVNRNVEGKHRA